MCSIDIWFSDSSSSDSDEKAIIQLRRERRRIRDKTNPLEMPENEFMANFCLNKNAFINLLNEVDFKLQKGVRSTSIPNILKLAVTLKFLTKGSYQNHIGKENLFGLAQTTVSLIFRDVINVLEKSICAQHIDIQYSESETETIQSKFKELSGLPGVIGCIDSFHVKIIAPKKELQYMYYNSKGYHSINVMIVCDHAMFIRYINAKHPGSSDETTIFDASTLKTYMEKRYEAGHRDSWLLGDNNYELLPYLMTQYRKTIPDSPQSRYNDCHAKAKKIVRNAIRILKYQFQCLSGKKVLHYVPKKASQIINVCAALHNICRAFNITPSLEEIDLPDSDNDESDGDDDPELDIFEDNIDAESIRSEIVNSLSDGQ